MIFFRVGERGLTINTLRWPRIVRPGAITLRTFDLKTPKPFRQNLPVRLRQFARFTHGDSTE